MDSGFEVLAQSVTMKKPLSLRVIKASAKACSVELRTGADPTPLVLDLLTPKNGLYGFNVRRGASKVLIEGQIRPFGPNKMSSLSIGRASVLAEASSTKRSAVFQLKGANPFDLTYERVRLVNGINGLTEFHCTALPLLCRPTASSSSKRLLANARSSLCPSGPAPPSPWLWRSRLVSRSRTAAWKFCGKAIYLHESPARVQRLNPSPQRCSGVHKPCAPP